MDGTLFDTKDVNYFAYRQALEELNYTMEYEYYCEFCNGRHFTEFIPPIIGKDKEMLLQIHERKKELYVKYLNRARINEHLFNLLKSIKAQYYCAIVTTASKKNCMDLLDAFDVRDLFDLVLTQSEIARKKPDPQGFFLAMEHFQMTPGQTIIFEDSETGVQAAQKTGADYYVVHGYN